MSGSVQEAREAFGRRLRNIRKAADLTGRRLADLEGWHESKVSKIEWGKLGATEADVRAYCDRCAAQDHLDDLLATLRNIDDAYMEWRRHLSMGLTAGQRKRQRLEQQARRIRNYQPHIVTGLLQTPEYAGAMIRSLAQFYQVPDDTEEAVAARMERQRILRKPGRQFHFLIGEQALYTTVGDHEVMAGQLEALLSAGGMPRVTFGIIPRDAETRGVLFNNFVILDNTLVHEEGSTARLSVTQPREILLYCKAFDILTELSVVGDYADALIRHALDARGRMGRCARPNEGRVSR